MGIGSQAELTCDQEVCMAVTDEGKDSKLPIEDAQVVILESLWHAGPWVHELQALGIAERTVKMPLYGW